MIAFCPCVQLKTYSDDRQLMETRIWKHGSHHPSKDTHLLMLATDTSPPANTHFKTARYHSVQQSTLTTYFLRHWEMSLSTQKIMKLNIMKPKKKERELSESHNYQHNTGQINLMFVMQTP